MGKRHLLVIINDVSSCDDRSVLVHFGGDSQLRDHILRQCHRLVVGVQGWIYADGARVQFLFDDAHGLSLSPDLLVFAGGPDGDVNVREDPNALSEILVLASDVRRSVDLDRRCLRLEDHDVAFDRRYFDGSAFVASELKKKKKGRE